MGSKRGDIPSVHHNNEEDVSLIDLYRILVERRIILITTMAVMLLAAIAYLLVATPTYESEVRLLPPRPTILSLSTPDIPYTQFDAKTVFQEFQARLQSREQWFRFVAENQDLFPPEAQRNAFIVTHPIKRSNDSSYPAEHIDIAYQHNESDTSAEILGRYLQFTRDVYVTDLVKEVEDRINRERTNISDDITILRQKARMAREDQIERLRQDINLAKTLGITENQLLRYGNVAQRGNDITLISVNENDGKYMRGTRILNAELEALLTRKSDDPYINGLDEKMIGLERLSSLQLIPAQFIPYLQDGDIAAPQNPIKPNKKIILVLALLWGGLIGVFLVFLVNAFKNKTQA